MNYDDIVRVPEGYAGDPIAWKLRMIFNYVREVLDEGHFTRDKLRYIRDKYGINANDYDVANVGLIIYRDKFNLDEFYAEFGPTNGSKDIELKKLKIDKLKKLTCECCNGTLDPSSIRNNIIKCDFCGTKYIVE